MSIIMIGKVNEPPFPSTASTDVVAKCYTTLLFAGYSIFWTGISVGISNLVCGYINTN